MGRLNKGSSLIAPHRSGQTLTYDADGNLLSDGQREFTWDAENRLVGITYPAEPGKATSFAYDGQSRRTSISSTPAGGGTATTTSYLWCGSAICQARNASGAITREYLAEGEYLPGSPAQPYYYGTDQLGSVRRVFASPTSASSCDFEPHGHAPGSTARGNEFFPARPGTIQGATTWRVAIEQAYCSK